MIIRTATTEADADADARRCFPALAELRPRSSVSPAQLSTESFRPAECTRPPPDDTERSRKDDTREAAHASTQHP